MLDPSLPALEVLQVDLGDLDARVAHESGQAVDLATALEPGAGEGVPELMSGDWDIGDAGRHFDSLQDLLDAPGRERFTCDVGEE
jgi:hypothetical protein